MNHKAVSAQIRDRPSRPRSIDGNSPFSFLPKDLIVLVLSFLSEWSDVLRSRRVCYLWERCLFDANLILRLPNPFTENTVLRALILFPRTQLFFVPDTATPIESVDWQIIYCRPEGTPRLDWSGVTSNASREFYLSALENIKAWQYIADSARTWLGLLDEKTESALVSRLQHALASAYIDLERFEEALIEYSKILTKSPSNMVAINDCGYVSLRMRRYPEALTYFTRAIDIAKLVGATTTLDLYYSNRAQAYSACCMHEKALEDYNQIVNITSEVERAKAHVLMTIGRSSEVALLFESIIRKNPSDSNAMHDLSCVYADQLNYDEALRLADSAIAVTKLDADLFYNRSRIHGEMGRYDLALEDIEAAITLEMSVSPASLYRRGRCNVRLGREAEARDDFNTVIQLTEANLPTNEIGWHARGHALLFSKRFAEAYECFSRGLATRSTQTDLLFGRAKAAAGRGMYEEAWADISKAVELKPRREFLDFQRELRESGQKGTQII